MDNSATVTDLLEIYEEHIKSLKETFLSKYTSGTTTAERKSAAKNDKVIHTIKTTSKRVGRVDAGKAYKYTKQEIFVINLAR